MQPATFQEVQAAYDSVKKNTYQQWAVNKANTKADGNWKLVELSDKDYSRIILPYHLHQNIFKKALIPKEGATLAQALDILQKRTNYGQTSPICWQSIEHLKQNTTPVILSTKPIPSFDYWFLNKRSGPSLNLYHVDGLHRLLAWALFEKNSKKYAYVARSC